MPMRIIHLANEKKRDAQVVFDAPPRTPTLKSVLPDGTEKTNVKLLKSTLSMDETRLLETYGSPEELASELIGSDPDFDLELTGRFLNHTHKLYVDQRGDIAYSLNLYQVIRLPDGTEKERHDLNKIPSNVNTAEPLKWTGKMFPKREAIRRFVFTRKYQVRHINGVTFDFLYQMARELQESDSVVLVGGGKKGTDPILLSRGGEPYRGFLEGRVEEDRYLLILHLSNIELKGVDHED